MNTKRKNPFVGKERVLDSLLAKLDGVGVTPAMLAAWDYAKTSVIQAAQELAEDPSIANDGRYDALDYVGGELDMTLDGESRDFVLDWFEDAIAAAEAIEGREYEG